MKLLFLHGWGFDAGFWDAVIALLPDFACVADDRGYFGDPRAPDAAGPVIAIGHSLGAMRALAAMPDACRGLIAINGFDRFAADEGAPGVPVRVIDRMLARLDGDAAATVADFRARCGGDAAFGPCHAGRLRDDLLALRDGDRRTASGLARFPILSLHGARDPILPADLRRAAFTSAARHESLTHAGAGHLLPLSHPQWCAGHIRAFAGRPA